MGHQSFTYRNPARRGWWGSLVLLVLVGAGNAFTQPSLVHILLGAAPVCLWGPFAYRVNVMVFNVTGDEMVIRNLWRTRTVRVPDVRGFDFGAPSSGAGRTIRVVTAAGVVPIDVYAHSAHTTRRARERLNGQHRELSQWLADYQQAASAAPGL